MCFAAWAIYGTRSFIDKMSKLRHETHRTRVTKLLKSEFSWWKRISPLLNGLCPSRFGTVRRTVYISTYVSFAGFDAVMGKSFLAGTWHSEESSVPHELSSSCVVSPIIDPSIMGNINFLELVAAVIPLLVWAPLLRGSFAIVQLDNTATVSF